MDFKSEGLKYLKEYKILLSSIKRLENRIDKLMFNGPKDIRAMTYDGIISGSRQNSDAINTIYEMQVLMQSLEQTKMDLAHVDDALNELASRDPLYKVILVEFYINNRDINDISNEVNYSVRHLQRLRHEALAIFAVQFLGVIAIDGV